ncbi:hypothetical protein [Sphingomonas morindae]|uniref:Uncharacterized protein n=1 Tax=Sphingomonas morindae TaxID=1541170 RepID=A0ABY4X858_9SPHN|nr:hypothetical protein [Sphingomonas morindae]USI73091.1 hypothetical protein LHA26_01010 [Sphingomonas morindae]
MNPPEMIVTIVLICVIGSIVRAKLGLPQRRACGRRRDEEEGDPRPSAALAASEAENAELRSELRALKARVATLERIATDSSTALDREIEALRDRA